MDFEAAIKAATEQQWQPTYFKAGPVEFAAFGDRLLVVEDEFKSGYECEGCEGTGIQNCRQCAGKGHYSRSDLKGGERDFKCSRCDGQGKIKCPECDGKGGLIVVPEVSQRRPTTGKVVSVGDKVKYFNVDDAVLFSNFAGHAITLDRSGLKVELRILHESEILASVKGHLELKAVRHQKDTLGI